MGGNDPFSVSKGYAELINFLSAYSFSIKPMAVIVSLGVVNEIRGG
jgi:hypothetical protein